MARGNLWIYGGLLLIAAALTMTAGHFQDAKHAAESAVVLTVEVGAARPAIKQPEEKSPPAYLQTPEMDMPEIEIDGNFYVGTVSFPSLGHSLPVMSDWSYARLELSPCRYAGSAYLDNMIIAAHNYPGHFGRLLELETGDTVFFSDMAGNVFVYDVTEIQQMGANALEEMKAGDWALTMFTCTPSGERRVAVRCARLPEDSVRLRPFELSVNGRSAWSGGKMRSLPEYVRQNYCALFRFCYALSGRWIGGLV